MSYREPSYRYGDTAYGQVLRVTHSVMTSDVIVDLRRLLPAHDDCLPLIDVISLRHHRCYERFVDITL